MGQGLTVIICLAACFLLVVVIRIVLSNFDTNMDTNAPTVLDIANITPAAEPVSVQQATQKVDLTMLPQEFVVLDLETTGLDPVRHEIIEFGAIRASINTTQQLAFQTLVKPEKHIPKHITEINGISQEMVECEGRTLEEALHLFLDFIQDLPLVTFNAPFDMRFLEVAAKKHGVKIDNRYTCALQMARRAWPGLPSYRLVDLARRGKLSDSNTHRAVGDCERALIIFTSAASTLGKQIRWSRLS